MKKLNKKGFTLMEMLIVVAIIAILIAIAIPTMTKALEKSRESTDAANIRSAYSEVMTMAMTEDTANVDNGSFTITYSATDKEWTATIPLSQKQDGWQNASIDEISGVKIPGGDLDDVGSGKSVTIVYSSADNTETFAVED